MKKFIVPVILALGAISAGFAGGFIGTGGGIILMFALGLAGDKIEMRDRFALVITVITPLSLISALIYNKNVDLTSAAPYILPGIIGGAVGALLLCRIKYSWLGRLFAIMVIFAGLCFIL